MKLSIVAIPCTVVGRARDIYSRGVALAYQKQRNHYISNKSFPANHFAKVKAETYDSVMTAEFRGLATAWAANDSLATGFLAGGWTKHS